MCEVLNAAGTVPDDNEELIISVINGNSTSRESLSNHVGMGSKLTRLGCTFTNYFAHCFLSHRFEFFEVYINTFVVNQTNASLKYSII